MFPVWEKFSKIGKDITQHAIQESNGIGGWHSESKILKF